eukprot:5864997-Karenia_brevis.AAC.1
MPHTARLATIKLRTKPRTISLFNMYAPSQVPNAPEEDLDRNQGFWDDFSHVIEGFSKKEVVVCAGDLNARLQG